MSLKHWFMDGRLIVFRAASLVQIIYAGLHTYGFQAFRPPSERGLAVMRSMSEVTFTVDGKRFSYGGFYEGFGLFVGAALLTTGALSWWLGQLAVRNPRDAIPPSLMLAGFHLAGLALCLQYFAVPPALLSAACAMLLLLGTGSSFLASKS